MGRKPNKRIKSPTFPIRRFQQGFELILCSKQQGNLWISKYACALRYKKALEMDQRIPDDDFGIAVKVGLEICRSCEIGRRYAERLLKIANGKKTQANQDKSEIQKTDQSLTSSKSPALGRPNDDFYGL